MSTCLSAHGLVKRFVIRSGGEATVLGGVDLDVRSGCLVVVESDPGAGRTTLVRCLYGTYRPDAGSISLTRAGRRTDLTAAPDRTVAWLRRSVLAAGDGRLVAPPRAPAAAVLSRAAGISLEEATCELTVLGARATADVPVGRLLAWEARLVALAAVLSRPAAVVLLDDPLAGLDDRRAQAVLRLIETRCEEGTAVLATTPTGGLLGSASSTTIRLEAGRLTWEPFASRA